MQDPTLVGMMNRARDRCDQRRRFTRATAKLLHRFARCVIRQSRVEQADGTKTSKRPRLELDVTSRAAHGSLGRGGQNLAQVTQLVVNFVRT